MNEPFLESEHEGDPSEYATRAEAEAAIKALTDGDKIKLVVVAKYYWKLYLRKSDFTHQDLLQEALVRTLETSAPRRWRKAVVTFVKHLDRSMESIARNYPATLKTRRHAEEATHSFDAEKPREGHLAPHPEPFSTSESQLLAREQLEEIEEALQDHPVDLKVVRCRALGMSAAEIQLELGLSDKDWETIRKRVREKLINFSE